MDISVSIIIVNYNSDDVIGECLLSIINKTRNINYEIIVIDNDSEKGSLDKLMEIYPQVNFQFMGKNLGFGAANNIGAAMAKGKYLYFLNPDTELVNNAVYILSQYMDSHPKTGICGGSMYNKDMSPATGYYDIGLLKLEYEILLNFRKNYQGINHTGTPKQVRMIVGSNLFIVKDIFQNVGGFDKDFFMYFEELELCDRVRKKGYQVVSVPDAKVIHLHGTSTENKNEELSKWSREELWYSKFVYFHKTNGKMQAKILRLVHLSKFRLAVLVYGLKGNKKKLDYWNSKNSSIEKAYRRYKNYAINKV